MKIEITVRSDAKKEFYDSICNGFIKKYGNDITFTKLTDDSLIGGFSAKVDGTVYDTSVKAKLSEIKKVITE